MSTKFIIEDREFINELERLQYEVEAKISIIAYALSMNIDSERFIEYQNDYVNTFKKYQDKKSEVERRFVRTVVQNPNKWNLDFKSGEIVID
jgi:hypothetical protein